MSPAKRRLIILSIAIIVGLAAGAAIVILAPHPRPNVLLITVDCLRPDFIGRCAPSATATPNLDRIALDGAIFKNSVAPAGWTAPCLVSIFTSLYPTSHGVDARARFIPEGVNTLADILRANGYRAPTLTPILSDFNYYYLGFEPSTEEIEDVQEENVIRWLESNPGKRFFLWYHFYTVHLPYSPPPPFDDEFKTEYEKLDAEARSRIDAVRNNVIVRKGSIEFQESDSPAVHALYRGEVRQVDAQMGKIIQKLKSLNLYDNTIVIVTADHGEELLDHGFLGHASTTLSGTVCDEILRVPLIMRYPGKIEPHTFVHEQVRTVDIAPTILEMLGIPPDPDFDGRSFFPLLGGTGSYEADCAFGEQSPGGYQSHGEGERGRMRFIRTNRWKLIHNVLLDRPEFELYDLAADPGERSNVVWIYPDVANQLKGKLAEWFVICSQKREVLAALDSIPELPPGAKPETPRVIRPGEGAVLTRESANGYVIVEWAGDPRFHYTVEYEVGEGDYYMKGTFAIVGTKKVFGRYAPDFWENITLYNPFRFRICVTGRPETWTGWVEFFIRP